MTILPVTFHSANLEARAERGFLIQSKQLEPWGGNQAGSEKSKILRN
jgi:hypothetical protein